MDVIGGIVPSGTCCLDFFAVIACSLDLGAKISPFSLKLCLSWYFITAAAKTLTHPHVQFKKLRTQKKPDFCEWYYNKVNSIIGILAAGRFLLITLMFRLKEECVDACVHTCAWVTKGLDSVNGHKTVVAIISFFFFSFSLCSLFLANIISF